MTTQEAFIQQILAEPDRDDIRLIYADWLQEQGQSERAEFIRLQIRLAREFGGGPTCERTGQVHIGYGKFTPRCRCTPCKLKRREYMVSRRYIYVEWFPHLCDQDGLRRGFLESVECPMSLWMYYGPITAHTQPVQRVVFPFKEPAHFEREPGFAPYSWSCLYGEEVEEYRTGSLIASPIYNLIQGGAAGWFQTPEEAKAALSDACLTWARQAPIPKDPIPKDPILALLR